MLQLTHWPYIQTITLSGELETDITHAHASLVYINFVLDHGLILSPTNG